MRTKKRIFLVAGARPNFMKIAPLYEVMKNSARLQPVIVHTGQHYDKNMSQVFFRELGLPKPHIYLGVGSGSHAVQTAKIMVEFEKVCLKKKPAMVLVVGDVNSTLACSVVSSKLLIPIAHIEAGLRSFDRAMPEEINRIVTDSLSDYLFTTCRDANRNLEKEGVKRNKIFFAGNVMIDSLGRFIKEAEKRKTFRKFSLKDGEYALLTLHRPSNVDDKATLEKILKTMAKISMKTKIIFPAHPRTKKQIEKYKLKKYLRVGNIEVIEPVGYLDALNLMKHSRFVLTDSGGMQEETTVLGVPCITMRENTERPITVTQGTSTLVGNNPAKITRAVNQILNGKYKKGRVPELWDGKSARRIAKILSIHLSKRRKISC